MAKFDLKTQLEASNLGAANFNRMQMQLALVTTELIESRAHGGIITSVQVLELVEGTIRDILGIEVTWKPLPPEHQEIAIFKANEIYKQVSNADLSKYEG